MSWAKRPKSDEPVAEQRSVTDERGRTWVGSVTSGRFEGGEQNAEVVWVCDDQPSETKLVSDLGVAPAEADDRWRNMEESEIKAAFERARPA
jgi:hypothetical protein